MKAEKAKEARHPDKSFELPSKKPSPEEEVLMGLLYPVLSFFGKWQMKENENMFKVTLRELRELKDCTKKNAAIRFGISEAIYDTYEKDPGLIPKIIACKMKRMWGISLDTLKI